MKYEFLTLIILAMCVFVPVNLSAQMGLPEELIDIPTAYTFQRGDLGLDFRIYDAGGVMSKVQLGIVDVLSLGLSLSIDGMIGSGQLNVPKGRPGIIAKLRIIDETTMKSLPTITLGYDDSLYANFMGKGVYVVVSKEISVSKMFFHVHGGINRPMESGAENVWVNVFIGGDWFIVPQFALIGEVEPVYPYPAGAKPQLYISYNFGFQYMPISNFRVGFFTKTRLGTTSLFVKELHVGYITKLF